MIDRYAWICMSLMESKEWFDSEMMDGVICLCNDPIVDVKLSALSVIDVYIKSKIIKRISYN